MANIALTPDSKASSSENTERLSVPELLVASLSRLNRTSDVRDFLDYVMAELVNRTGAANAAVTQYDPSSNLLTLELFHTGRTARWGPSGNEIELWSAAYDADITPAFAFGRVHRGPFVASMLADQCSIPIQEFALPGGLEWAASISISDMACCLLMVGDEPVGTLHLHFTGGRTLSLADLPLLEGLSQQVAIAVRMLELNEQAKLAAIAREKEETAAIRAVEAHRISTFLSMTLGRMTEGNDLHAAIDHILTGLATELGASHVFLFRHDPTAHTIRLESSYIDGQLRSGPSGVEVSLWGAPFPDDITPAWKIMTERRGLFTPDMAPIPATEFAWPGALEYASRFELSDIGHIVLFAGDVPVGSMGIGLRSGRKITAEDKRFIEEVANQAALSIRMLDLAEQAKQTALAETKEKAAQQRAAELAKANQALQATIDALGEAASLDQIVPRVLTIVAETFGSTSCLVYLNHPSGRIRLLYWNIDGRTLTPDELLQLDPQKFGLIRLLADGFEIPDDYLGMPATAIGTVVLDHVRGTLIPEFDAFVVGSGWDLQLNVGVGAGGVRTSTLVICRKAGDPFTPMEIALAESLATQVGLAVEFARLAEETKQTAISHELEALARQRAAELSKANDAMRQAIESLAIEPDLISFAGRLLMIIGQQFGAPVVEYWKNESAHVATLKLTCRDGRLYPGSDMKEDPRASGIVIPQEMTGVQDLYTPRAHFFSDDLPNDPTQQAVFSPLGLDIASWCSERGVRRHLNVPLRSGDRTFGALVIYIPAEQQFTDVRIELAYALAHQMTLAIRLTDLALESQRATIAKEREDAALNRAAELAKANTAITDGLRRMATESNLSRMPGMILLEVCRNAGADACCWLDYNPDQHTLNLALRSRQGAVSDQPGPDEPPIFRLPFAADLTPAFEYLLATDELVELSAPELYNYVWPGVMQWHNNNGRTSMLACAVKVGDQPVGVLGMSFRCSMDMTRSQRELIRALANHLALAVHLTRLSRKANSAALLDERNRIARDIHDSLAQHFTGILMQLQAANRFSEKNPQIARSCVDRAESLARNGLKEARRSVMSLVQGDEHYQDLGLALRSLVETVTADTGTRSVVNVSGDTRVLHPSIAVNLLRVCQEALGNAQRYAHAEWITVDLTFTSHMVKLEIKDNGIGFVQSDVARSGFGLAGMRERAERINGMLTIDSALGKGTRIILEAPLDESTEALH